MTYMIVPFPSIDGWRDNSAKIVHESFRPVEVVLSESRDEVYLQLDDRSTIIKLDDLLTALRELGSV